MARAATVRHNLPGVARAWRRMPEDVSRAAEVALRRFGKDLVADAVDYLRDAGTNVDGDLSKSIESEVDRTLARVELVVDATARHADPVHEGSRPHWPPRAPIEVWVRKKLAVTETGEVKRVAFLVARKISRRGTKAVPFLADPWRKRRATLVPRIVREVQRAVDRRLAEAHPVR
jgi:hypothetical protein